jgi:drug/metabolite transporter (DMT)-like permease
MAIGLIILGVVFYGATQGAQFVALDNQPATTTSLVLSLTPLLVAGFAVRSLSETASVRQLLGAVLVAVGAWFYFAGELGATVPGMTAALVGLGTGVASALLGRHLNRQARVAPVAVTAISMAVGAAILVLVGFTTEGLPTVSLRAWLIIGWLALVNTALAFTLWNLSLRRLSALAVSRPSNRRESTTRC